MKRNRLLPRAALIGAICVICGSAFAQFLYRRAELVRVVDGDTVRLTLEIAPGQFLRNQSCRLLRIDAPEMRTELGPHSKRGLEEFLAGKKLEAEARARDRFGRLLIELTADGDNVSDWMVSRGYAAKR